MFYELSISLPWVLLFSLSLILIFVWLQQKRKISQELVGKNQETSLVLIHQQIEGLRNQFQQNLESTGQVFTQQIQQLNQQLYERFRDQGQILQGSQESMGQRLDNAARVVGELQSRLGKMEEANLRIFEVGRDIASLQEILRAPKLRGTLGEFFLGDLLKQLLPHQHFELQYGFKQGDRVDAVIKLGDGLVPVDAKFPLENFKRWIEAQGDNDKRAFRKVFLQDVKKHIDAIALKYIRPDEKTFDFALMYIPAENVYYEMIIKDETSDEFCIVTYAMKKRVIPVSPNNFYVYLNTILLGLKGMKINENAQAIQATLSHLQNDFKRLLDDFSKLGTHLNHARSSFEVVDKRMNRLGEKFDQILETNEEHRIPIHPSPLKVEWSA